MAVQLDVTTDVDISCGYVKIEDVSVYSASPNSRVDFGIAIFVQLPDFSYDYGLTNYSNSDPWYISIQNNILYVFDIYQIPTWIADTWVHNQVVWYEPDGLFYYVSDPAFVISTEIPGISPKWTEVPNNLTGRTLISGHYTSYACALVRRECPNYSLQKVQCDPVESCCKQWQICDNSGSSYDKEIALFDYNLNFIAHTVLDTDGPQCHTINIPNQGVYIVGIKDSGGTLMTDETWEDPNSYDEFLVIYEYCQLTNCFQYLADQILCSNDPCAEICNPCDQSKILLDRNNRLEINKMIALFGTLLGMINAERVKYLGVYDMDVTRADFVSKIGMYFVKINEISIRCGICIGQDVSSTDNAIFREVISTSTGRSRGCVDCG